MSEFSRETLLNIIETDHVQCGEASALARMALAAMDSEPVAYSLIFRNMDGVLNNYINTNTTFATREKAEAYGKGGSYEKRSDGGLEWVPNPALDPVVVPLYRHAQPAPVVPDAYVRDEGGRMMLNGVCEPKIGFGTGWNACRAAMLQELQKSAGDEVICRSNENAQVLNTIKATPALGSFPKAGEVQNTNPPENPGCWCRTCRPVVLNDMRFVVCPDCGNKRCPRASDHRNACTGSNEPGQEGSAYPDTPREVK